MANGLFLSPEQALAAEAQMRQQAAYAQGFSPISAQAQELGRAMVGAFGSAVGAPMQESPDVQLARKRMEAVKGLDPSNPMSFREAAKSLYQAGDMEGATLLLSQANTFGSKREILKDAEGFNRYVDTGERVFPDAKKPEKEGKWQSKTFLMADGSFKSGSYDPETNTRILREGGKNVIAPDSVIDVAYRVENQPRLSLPDIKELGEKSSTVDSLIDLTNSFKDAYGGWGFEFVGDVVNTSKKVFGDDSGQAIWWQSHDRLKNNLRHELFGSALTQTEATNFDKITIHPGMHPNAIKENLAMQMTIAKSAAMKLVNAQRAKGISDDQVKAAVGPVVWSFVQPKDMEKKETKRYKYNPKTGRLE